jgi:hypothetical protein
MKRLTLLLVLSLIAGAACTRHKPAVDATHPYAAEQSAAKTEVAKRYDVNHDPNDTMSVNSMGSD